MLNILYHKLINEKNLFSLINLWYNQNIKISGEEMAVW